MNKKLWFALYMLFSLLLQMMFSRSLQTTLLVWLGIGVGILVFARRLHLDRLSIDEIIDKWANKWEENENASMNNIVLPHASSALPAQEKNALINENVIITNT
jgi:hypothetical protein